MSNTTVALMPEEEGKGTFAVSDLDQLAQAEGSAFLQVVRGLVQFAQEAPKFNDPDALYGRFALTSQARSAADLRLAFRLARQSLDFLEADYLACEKAEVEFWKQQVAHIENMRRTTPLVTQAAHPTKHPSLERFKVSKVRRLRGRRK